MPGSGSKQGTPVGTLASSVQDSLVDPLPYASLLQSNKTRFPNEVIQRDEKCVFTGSKSGSASHLIPVHTIV